MSTDTHRTIALELLGAPMSPEEFWGDDVINYNDHPEFMQEVAENMSTNTLEGKCPTNVWEITNHCSPSDGTLVQGIPADYLVEYGADVYVLAYGPKAEHPFVVLDVGDGKVGGKILEWILTTLSSTLPSLRFRDKDEAPVSVEIQNDAEGSPAFVTRYAYIDEDGRPRVYTLVHTFGTWVESQSILSELLEEGGGLS